VIVGRGCLRRPWLFRELAQVFDGRVPGPQPTLGGIVEIMLEHARRLIALFGPRLGIHHMRKWCLWYTAGFRGAATVRQPLLCIESIADLTAILARLDPTEPFPTTGLRHSRAKDGRRQDVRLPANYLEKRGDDSLPAPLPEAWDAALDGG
jgi:hypothetical protein